MAEVQVAEPPFPGFGTWLLCSWSWVLEQLTWPPWWTLGVNGRNKCVGCSKLILYNGCVSVNESSSVHHFSTFPHEHCCYSVAQSFLTLSDPTDCGTPGFPVFHYLLELAQTHVIESVMPSNHLVLCCPLLLTPLIFSSIRVFSTE